MSGTRGVRVWAAIVLALGMAAPAWALVPLAALQDPQGEGAADDGGEAGEAATASADVPPLLEFTLAAVGDVMMHGAQVSAARGGDGRYVVADPFVPVAGAIVDADVAFANLETVLGGEDMAYSGYPTFNSPRSLAGALFDAGFDVVQTANNHCMDRREKGLQRTLQALDAEGLYHVGTRADPGADPTLWIDVVGLRLAFLAYTFSTNGIPLPPGREQVVSMIDAGQMAADIAAAREAGADLVIVGCHWGIEYRHEPEPATVALAHDLVEAGADVVLGGHPHYLQPYEVLTTADGREGFVVYSLGNFLSNMRKRYQDAGIVLQLTFHARPGVGAALADVQYVPTWVDTTDETGAAHFQVVDIRAAEPTCGHAPRLDGADCAAMRQALRDTLELLGDADLAPLE